MLVVLTVAPVDSGGDGDFAIQNGARSERQNGKKGEVLVCRVARDHYKTAKAI